MLSTHELAKKLLEKPDTYLEVRIPYENTEAHLYYWVNNVEFCECEAETFIYIKPVDYTTK